MIPKDIDLLEATRGDWAKNVTKELNQAQAQGKGGRLTASILALGYIAGSIEYLEKAYGKRLTYEWLQQITDDLV